VQYSRAGLPIYGGATGHVYTIYDLILLIVTVMRYVSVRSAVLHAHLIPFVHTRRMSPEDTNIDLTSLVVCFLVVFNYN